MSITQKLKLNTYVALINKIVLIVSGLILPRFILNNFGSETNGLISSINQFLSIITFLDLGVGSVVQSSLYSPLYYGDNEKISLVLSSAKRFFRNIARVLVIYVAGLMILFPVVLNSSFDFFSTAFLILSMAIGIFAQYYFGIVNELLLNADQRGYIQLGTESFVVILNLIVSVLMIEAGFSIQMVKLVSGLVYLIRPLMLSAYVSKHFNITDKLEVNGEPIKQKWNGMAQHVAYVVQNNTDIVVLSFFSTFDVVSVYSIYALVVNGVQTLMSSLFTGLRSFFGNLLVKNDLKLINEYFSNIEWGIHTGVVYLFGMTSVLIDPFVMIYTKGVTDVNYYSPIFALIFTLSRAVFCMRTPYQSIILSAGHFKETQSSSIIEAIINIVISLSLVGKFGLVGVSVGTLIAMIYRTFYLTYYLSKNIIFRPLRIFIKQLIIDIVSFCSIFLIAEMVGGSPDNFVDWVKYAVMIGAIFMVVLCVINIFVYREKMTSIFKKGLR